MKLGIFGGSFDPIHYGHLILAEYLREGAGLDRVLLMPAYESPFKIGQTKSDAASRLKMVELATQDHPSFDICDLDISGGRVSYMVDLMASLRKMYPTDELYYLSGTDSFLGIECWRGSEELLSRYSFAVGTRPGYRDEELAEFAEYIRAKYHTEVQVVPIPKVEISSTDIRHRCKEEHSIRYLVPEAVERFIHENQLYIG